MDDARNTKIIYQPSYIIKDQRVDPRLGGETMWGMT
jgi:hypothetical protein